MKSREPRVVSGEPFISPFHPGIQRLDVNLFIPDIVAIVASLLLNRNSAP